MRKLVVLIGISLALTAPVYAGDVGEVWGTYVGSPGGGSDLLTSGSDADSTTSTSDSGLELVGGQLTIIRGCNDTQILKWVESTDTWDCSADATSAGGGNSIYFEHAGAAVGNNATADITLDATTGLDLSCVGNDCTLLLDAAQSGITSLGTLTTLAVDNITINGNDISSTAGTDLTITPLAGQQIVLDGTIVVDAGVVTGATSITSTAFVGALTGNADTATTATTATTANAGDSATAFFSSGTLEVGIGGTGASTLTDGGILLGSGTGAITPMGVLANGSIVVGDGTTDPVALAAFTGSTGTLKHESGGLEADVSAYAGLVSISAGSTSNITGLAGLNTALGSSIADGAHTTDTSANTICAGTTTYLDGEGNCDDISSVYQAAGTYLSNVSEDATPTLGGALDAGGFDINNGGVIFLTEQAAAEVDVAGKGQIWVKTATPNQLWFTDDAGTDTQLGVGGAETNSLQADGAGGIADTQIFIGTGAGTGNYAALSSEATMSNTGAVTLADSVAVTSWNLTTPTITTQFTLTAQADPTTDADGEVALDTDGWGSGYDAIEYFNGTASAYLVATTAADAPQNGQVPKWNTGGTITWEDDTQSAGSATAWDDIGNPDADATIAFGDFEETITSSLDKIGVALKIDHTDADVINATTIFQIQSVDDAPANLTYFNIVDNTAVTPNSVFSIGADGAVTSDGVVTSTGFTIGSAAITETELEIIDGATLTTTQLEYLNAATGTTGTASTNLVFSTSPTLTTPALGVATATSITAGSIILSDGLLDGVGAVDMDYGSPDVTDHTFVTDGTGTAEIVLPAGSIDSTEILDDTIVNADINSAAAIAISKTALTAGRSLTLSTNDLLADAELYTETISIIVETPADADAFLFWKAPQAVTITDIDCITAAATSAVIDVQECTSAGATCATVDATITCDSDGAADDGTLTNGAIDAGDWLNLDIGTVTGTVGEVTVTITYTKDD